VRPEVEERRREDEPEQDHDREADNTDDAVESGACLHEPARLLHLAPSDRGREKPDERGPHPEVEHSDKPQRRRREREDPVVDRAEAVDEDRRDHDRERRRVGEPGKAEKGVLGGPARQRERVAHVCGLLLTGSASDAQQVRAAATRSKPGVARFAAPGSSVSAAGHLPRCARRRTAARTQPRRRSGS
jgi:hypothetical protein